VSTGDPPKNQNLAPELHVDEDTFAKAVRHSPLVDLSKRKRETGKVGHSELGLYIAALRVGGRGEYRSVPVEVLDLVGEILLSKREWNSARVREQKAWAAAERAYWRALAEPVRQRNPDFTDEAVAEIIVPRNIPDDIRPTLVNSVRRQIADAQPRRKSGAPGRS
jgi:hypothetical protein